MKKSYIWIIIGVVILISVLFLSNRYYIQVANQGIVYKIDRLTGKTWIITNGRERLVEPQQKERVKTEEELRQEEIENEQFWEEIREDRAIRLVKRSYMFEKYKTTEKTLDNEMKNIKGDLKIEGWQTRKWEDDIYVVTYSFSTKNNNYLWAFEAQLDSELVRMITGDKELQNKYGIEYTDQ